MLGEKPALELDVPRKTAGTSFRGTVRGTVRLRTRVEPVLTLVKNFFMKIWKMISCTPFGIMLLLRVYMVFWALRYNTCVSILIVVWTYYSIWYQDSSRFFAFMPYLLIPAISLQLLGTKFVQIPRVMGEVISVEYLKYFIAFGGLPFSVDKSLTPKVEYLITLAGLFLVCATLKMVQYIPEYEDWSKKETAKAYKNPNLLEIIVRFFMDHVEKIYLIILYLIALNVLNVIHTLALVFLILFTLLRDKTKKYFPAIILILGTRTLGRYGVLAGYIFEANYTSKDLRILKIIGFNIDWDDSVKSSLIYRIGFEWELIIMYLCSYIQLRILQYISKNPFSQIPINWENLFIKFASFLYYLFQTYLLWVIYFTFIFILAYQSECIFIQGYIIIMVVMVTAHIMKDLNDVGYQGYLYVQPLWTLLNVYNSFILLASYITYFVAYTAELSTNVSEATLEIIKIVGLKFTDGEDKKLQSTFLPQFIMLYLGFIARWNMMAQRDNPPEREVKYTKSSWMWLIGIVDWFTKYSFHMLFLVFGLFAVLWSLNFLMLACLMIFGIHYSVLHAKYVNAIKFTDDVPVNYQEKQQIINGEYEVQKAKMLSQSKITLNFLIILVFVALIATQLFPFVHLFKEYVDRFDSSGNSKTVIHNLEILEALGCFLGTIGKESPRTPMIKLIIGYLVLLVACAVEIRGLNWYRNRMGYTFTRVFPETKPNEEEERASIFDIFKYVIFKYALASEKKMKYLMTTMMIIKTLLEYLVVGSFLFSVTGKNNFLEIAFIIIAAVCLFAKLTLKRSQSIASYMWFLFLIQFLLFVLNATRNTVPQEIDEAIFVKAFRVPDWPSYNILFKNIASRMEWGLYLGLGGTNITRYFFCLDVCIFIFQGLYFQHFSHSFYTLSGALKEKDKDKEQDDTVSIIPAGMEKRPSKLMKFFYKFVKNVLFIYSHIFTLFCLLIMTFSTKGAIDVLYLGFSVLFMQFDLFGKIGSKKWTLSIFFKYVLKPYTFIDLSAQFIYQVPYFLQVLNPDVMSLIGIHRRTSDDLTIWIKIIIYIVVLYQDTIYSSKEYRRMCRHERMKIKNLVLLVITNSNSRKESTWPSFITI